MAAAFLYGEAYHRRLDKKIIVNVYIFCPKSIDKRMMFVYNQDIIQ